MDSVVLDKDLSTEIIDDMKKFQNSAQWYIDKGVPYRRGYLLYGPPGSGKTSFTQAIAGKMNLNICYLNLSGNNMDDDGLNRALNDAPAHSIILLEDVDSLFV
jgi:chaperone BCS1